LQNYTRHIRIRLLELTILPLLYFICRLLFFAFNYSHFSNTGFLELGALCFSGLRFDISAILMLNTPFLFLALLPFPFIANKGYQLAIKILFLTVNILGLATNCLDIVYYKFTLRRLTWDFMSLLQRKNDFASFASYLYGYWYIFLIFAFFIWILLFFYGRIEKKKPLPALAFMGSAAFIANLMSLVVLSGATVLGIRGGWQLSPLSLSHAGEYASPSAIPVLLNSPFSIIDSHKLSHLAGHRYFSEKDRLRLFDPMQLPSGKPLQKPNVVIIIMESFSKEFTFLSNQKSYTPFLDSLMKQGYLFNNAFSNGKRSAEGIPAILGGIPSLMDEGYPSSAYASNELYALPRLLKPYGYSSAFFHGGNDGTMNFDAFASNAGFEHYYGRQEYNNDKNFDGNWGIWDEPFLQFFASKLKEMQEPFCTSVFTLSSHDPFLVPDAYRDKFPAGNRTINPCVGYADYALRKFFQTAQQAPWFNNTLFVICPDHTGYSDDPFWGNNIGQYEIPILFYQPGKSLRGVDSTTMQQIDILPTVLAMIGYDKPFFAFGKNALDKSQPHFAINYRNNMYQLFEGNHLLQFDGEKVRGYFNIRKDSLLQHDGSQSPSADQQRMEEFIKAYLQCYEQSLIQNKMKP